MIAGLDDDVLLDLIPGYREAEGQQKADRIRADLIEKSTDRLKAMNPEAEITKESIGAMMITIQQEEKR